VDTEKTSGVVNASGQVTQTGENGHPEKMSKVE